MGGLGIGVLFCVEVLRILCLIGLGYFGYKTSLGKLSISAVFICEQWIVVFHHMRSYSTSYDPSGSSWLFLLQWFETTQLDPYFGLPREYRNFSSIDVECHFWNTRDFQDKLRHLSCFKSAFALHSLPAKRFGVHCISYILITTIHSEVFCQ
jgi:hypothetical protein